MPITNLNPYVTFNGQAADAIALYTAALGAKAESVMRWADMPPQQPGEVCQGATEPPNPAHIMHAELRVGDRTLMLSDGPAGQPVTPSSSISIALNFSDLDEAHRAFAALTANGGKTLMPISDAFWGASFGMATDPFGVTWLFNCPKK